MLLLSGIALTVAVAQAGMPVTRPQPRRLLSHLVQNDDYPREAFARGEQGTVFFALLVLPNGRVGNCRVTRSSGSSSLDARTCEIMVRHARFVPARDAQGNPVSGTHESSLGWFLR
jgi:periplasmic protein TonB